MVHIMTTLLYRKNSMHNTLIFIIVILSLKINLIYIYYLFFFNDVHWNTDTSVVRLTGTIEIGDWLE